MVLVVPGSRLIAARCRRRAANARRREGTSAVLIWQGSDVWDVCRRLCAKTLLRCFYVYMFFPDLNDVNVFFPNLLFLCSCARTVRVHGAFNFARAVGALSRHRPPHAAAFARGRNAAPPAGAHGLGPVHRGQPICGRRPFSVVAPRKRRQRKREPAAAAVDCAGPWSCAARRRFTRRPPAPWLPCAAIPPCPLPFTAAAGIRGWPRWIPRHAAGLVAS